MFALSFLHKKAAVIVLPSWNTISRQYCFRTAAFTCKSSKQSPKAVRLKKFKKYIIMK